MFDFIPHKFYESVYYYILFIVVLLTFVNTQKNLLGSIANYKFIKVVSVFLLIFVIIYIGLRPIGGFGDMYAYNTLFERYAAGDKIEDLVDISFHVFTKLSSQAITAQMYFLLCACLYIIPLYLVCKKWFKHYWFYGFLFLVVSFSFWGYGTNGIRNGMAGSLALFAMSRNNRIWQGIFLVLAVTFHKSIFLPALGFIFATFYNKPKIMIGFWILAIPVSLLFGGTFESIFSTVTFDEDDWASRYLTNQVNEERFSNTGFRWDFLLYSATAVFAGWYYIIKLKYNDKLYIKLFNTYVFANAFWILVIRANYSNRFAYLSWFMIAIIIMYPLLKNLIIPKQHRKIGNILLLYFAFTFIMNVILK